MSGLTLPTLEYYRMRAGMSPQELAEAASCSLRTVQRIEGKDNHLVNFSTARRIAQALKIELTELVSIGLAAEQSLDENAEGKNTRVIEAFLAADSAAEAALQKYGPWGFQEGIVVASLFAARYCYGMSVQMDDDGPEPVDKRELAFEIWALVKALTERAIDNNFPPVGGDRET